ncbi:hypothetical protein CR513_33913, partial [Mucuna pruriens]
DCSVDSWKSHMHVIYREQKESSDILKLVGYTDSDWARDIETRKSTSGWMDFRLDHNRHVRLEFTQGVNDFIEFVTSQDNFQRQYHHVDDVMVHLYERGFMKNYYYWMNHGESMPPHPSIMVEESYYGGGERGEEYDPFEHMVMDHVRPEVGQFIDEEDATMFHNVKEDPHAKAKIFMTCWKFHKLHCGIDFMGKAI